MSTKGSSQQTLPQGVCLCVELTTIFSDVFPFESPASMAATTVVIGAGGLGDTWAHGSLARPPETEDDTFAIFTVWIVMCVECVMCEGVRVERRKMG